MASPWTRCPFPWPWTEPYFLSWHSISMQDWNRERNLKKWQEPSRMIFWKSSWCVTPIFIRLPSLWRLSPTSLNTPLKRCLSSIQSLSPAITCRKQVLRQISNWLIPWPTVWNISVQVLQQVSISMPLLRACRSSGLSVWITLWRLPKCVPHVCYGQNSWNSSTRKTRSHWLCVLTRRLQAGHWPNKIRSIT